MIILLFLLDFHYFNSPSNGNPIETMVKKMIIKNLFLCKFLKKITTVAKELTRI